MWFYLCLQKPLMQKAIEGCKRLRVWNADDRRVRQQLYKWARAYSAWWGIPLSGGLFATLEMAASWQTTFVCRQGGLEFLQDMS